MNILYFIGNGFDLNIGMKTKYSDFYNYYKKIDSKDEIIKQLKNEILNDYKNWADLELALGSYTTNLNSEYEFDILFEDILKNLAEYLESEEGQFDFNNFKKEKLYNYLCQPEDSLLKADSNDIKTFKNDWSKINWSIEIITFNYTKTLEKILNKTSSSLQIGIHHQNAIILKDIEHLHGFIDDRMIMGVNDTSQISNENFHENRNILEAFVKSNCNKAQKHTIDDVCKTKINSAHLICIFGSSIGDTDNCWWELIGERLKKGTRLILFTRGDEINKRIGYKNARTERIMKNYFLNKTTLTAEEKLKVENNIYIGVNTNMFNNLKD